MKFGMKIRFTRVSAGITAEQLSEKSGVHVNTIYKIENDLTKEASPLVRMKLCRALGLPDEVAMPEIGE